MKYSFHYISQKKSLTWDEQNSIKYTRWAVLFPVYTLFNYFESLPTI